MSTATAAIAPSTKPTSAEQNALNNVFFEAFEKGKTEVWQYALKQGANINFANGLALTYAAAHSPLGQFELLLKEPSLDPNIDNTAAFLGVIERKSTEKLRIFLQREDLKINLNYGLALSLATQSRNLKALELLVAHPATNINLVMRNSDAPFYVAADKVTENRDVLKIYISSPKFEARISYQAFKMMESFINNSYLDLLEGYLQHPNFDRLAFKHEHYERLYRKALETRDLPTIKALVDNIDPEIFNHAGYNAFFHDAMDLNTDTPFKPEIIQYLLPLFSADTVKGYTTRIANEFVGTSALLRPMIDHPGMDISEIILSAIGDRSHENVSFLLSQPEAQTIDKAPFAQVVTRDFSRDLTQGKAADAILNLILSLPDIDVRTCDQSAFLLKCMSKKRNDLFEKFPSLPGFKLQEADIKALAQEAMRYSGPFWLEKILELPSVDKAEALLGAAQSLGYDDKKHHEKNDRKFDMIAPHLGVGFDFRKAAQMMRSDRLSQKFLAAADKLSFDSAPQAALGGLEAFEKFMKTVENAGPSIKPV